MDILSSFISIKELPFIKFVTPNIFERPGGRRKLGLLEGNNVNTSKINNMLNHSPLRNLLKAFNIPETWLYDKNKKLPQQTRTTNNLLRTTMVSLFLKVSNGVNLIYTKAFINPKVSSNVNQILI